MIGLPGAGKTTRARRIEEQTGAVRFSTDEWMADLGLDFYDERRELVQARLDRLWRQLLEQGLSVVLEDGTCKRSERDSLREFASGVGASTVVHYFNIGLDELWRRLELRNQNPPYGTAPISRAILEECWSSRMERPDRTELESFDQHVVHVS